MSCKAVPVKLLVCGAGGMLGQDVVRAAETANHQVAGLDREGLDVTNPRAVRRVMERERPAAVVNCAAWTDVDGAESDLDGAMRLNAQAAGRGGRGRGDGGRRAVLYPSTDYVFDGRSGRPYVESDPVAPESAYGRSKLAGEQATAAANPRHYVVRTSWLFGAGGRNFVETMLQIGGRDGAGGGGPWTRSGSPTYTGSPAYGDGGGCGHGRLRRAPHDVRRASAAGTTSPWPSSPTPGWSAGCSPPPRPSSPGPPPAPPTRCWTPSWPDAIRLPGVAGRPARVPGRPEA